MVLSRLPEVDSTSLPLPSSLSQFLYYAINLFQVPTFSFNNCNIEMEIIKNNLLTTDGDRLINTAVTINILSSKQLFFLLSEECCIIFIESVCCKILYFLRS